VLLGFCVAALASAITTAEPEPGESFAAMVLDGSSALHTGRKDGHHHQAFERLPEVSL